MSASAEEARTRHALRRDEWPSFARVAYLDHGLRGPVPASAIAAARAALELCARGSSAREGLAAIVEKARSAVGRLLDAPAAEVSFHGNATAALAALAGSIRWRRGDVVVTTDAEYASTVLPFRARARLEVVPCGRGELDTRRLARALRGRARAVVLGAAAFPSGAPRDVAAIARAARRAGAWTIVDASWTLGLRPFAPGRLGVDAAVACGRKWLMGPPECGILWVRSDRLRELAPATAGALSREDPLAPLDAPLRGDARALEGGVLAAPILAGLARAVELVLAESPARIEARAVAVARAIEERARAEDLEVERPAGSAVVHLRARGSVARLERALADGGAVARVVRPGVVRASAHFWNDARDAGRLVSALASRARA
jgi:selenocysteine lyase/cysteine desulfurase